MAGETSTYGQFVIDSTIGEGRMGTVYRARDKHLERWVALKVLTAVKENKEFAARFYSEARAAARIIHPNVLQIYSVGEEAGLPYYAMEFMEGTSLETLIRTHPVPFMVEEIIEIVRCVVRSLIVAVQQEIVHRDIKPANIMIDKHGHVKVTDFGLAKGLNTSRKSTCTGVIIGTPAYMSPEQGEGKPVDTRSDIYSLGCVMYECLCDRVPFDTDDVAALIHMHATEPPEPPGRHREGLDPQVEKICMTMLAKNPAERYQTPQDALEALAAVATNTSLTEVLLAKRVDPILRSRKVTSVRILPPKKSTVMIFPDVTAPTVIPSPVRQSIPAAQAAPAPAQSIPSPVGAVNYAESATAGQPALNFAPAGLQTLPPAPVTPLPSLPPKTSEAQVKAAAAKLYANFEKMDDGRWTYKTSRGRCDFAEGLATQVPAHDTELKGLGDCLLCSNWNKRLGCALAFNFELESKRRFAGLRLLVEQATAWLGAGRADMAVAVLQDYVNQNPNDPEGYRELARVYDWPEYPGPEKRRAIVLYQRFAELARAKGAITPEIKRAEDRASALKALPVEGRSVAVTPGEGVCFQAFYRGRVSCFAFGILTREFLTLARAGDVDPFSGVSIGDLGGAGFSTASIFRRFKSEQARKEEQAQVKKEMTRLSQLSLEVLQKDPACAATIRCEQIAQVAINVDEPQKIVILSFKAPQPQQLLFPELGRFKAEQCYELLRRKTEAGV